MTASQADSTRIAAWAETLTVETEWLRGLVRAMVGDPASHLVVLAEKIAELGRYDVAQQLSSFGQAALEARQASGEPEPGPERADADDLALLDEQKIRKIGDQRRHIKGIEASIRRANQELARLLDEAGVDELALPLGTLRRTRSEDPAGEWDFRIEV